MPLQNYVIGGMDPEFREQLYHAGKAMDAAGIQWSLLSAFRDDYRQGIATGFKARVGNSLHGGSRATGGYGHGRAIDVVGLNGTSSEVWKWIDANGAKYGLYRPIPGPDPAHVQSRGDWRKLAVALRQTRVGVADATGALGKDIVISRDKPTPRKQRVRVCAFAALIANEAASLPGLQDLLRAGSRHPPRNAAMPPAAARRGRPTGSCTAASAR